LEQFRKRYFPIKESSVQGTTSGQRPYFFLCSVLRGAKVRIPLKKSKGMEASGLFSHLWKPEDSKAQLGKSESGSLSDLFSETQTIL